MDVRPHAFQTGVLAWAVSGVLSSCRAPSGVRALRASRLVAQEHPCQFVLVVGKVEEL